MESQQSFPQSTFGASVFVICFLGGVNGLVLWMDKMVNNAALTLFVRIVTGKSTMQTLTLVWIIQASCLFQESQRHQDVSDCLQSGAMFIRRESRHVESYIRSYKHTSLNIIRSQVTFITRFSPSLVLLVILMKRDVCRLSWASGAKSWSFS